MKRFRLFIFINIIYLIVPYACTSESQQELQSQDQKNEIIFGQSANLSGSMKLYGIMIQHGILTYFNHINKQGGINGKKLRLITLNDYGNPLKTEKNIHRLKKQGVSMFLGTMGTRSLLKILPMIERKEIAMLFPWGSHPKLQNKNLSNIINGPGFLEPQIDAIVNYITENIREQKIGIFCADDDFSLNTKNYLVELLKKFDITPVNISAYNRLTMDITLHARELIASDPKIVICISTSIPTVRLINQFFKNGHYATTFFGVDSTAFTSNILKGKGVSFFYSSPVPHPTQSTLQIALDYGQNLKKFFPNDTPNILSFMYYLSAAIVVEALTTTKEALTPAAVINTIERMKNYNINGFMVNFNETNRHAYGDTITLLKGS